MPLFSFWGKIHGCLAPFPVLQVNSPQILRGFRRLCKDLIGEEHLIVGDKQRLHMNPQNAPVFFWTAIFHKLLGKWW